MTCSISKIESSIVHCRAFAFKKILYRVLKNAGAVDCEHGREASQRTDINCPRPDRYAGYEKYGKYLKCRGKNQHV